MVCPLEDLDKIKQLLDNLIDSEEFLQSIIQIAEAEDMSIPQTSNQEDAKNILLEEIKRRINNLYEPTKQHVEQRKVFQKKVFIYKFRQYQTSTFLIKIPLRIGDSIYLLSNSLGISISCLRFTKEH